ncbi:hypothetical protein ACJX0J_009376 [Zea mays]
MHQFVKIIVTTSYDFRRDNGNGSVRDALTCTILDNAINLTDVWDRILARPNTNCFNHHEIGQIWNNGQQQHASLSPWHWTASSIPSYDRYHNNIISMGLELIVADTEPEIFFFLIRNNLNLLYLGVICAVMHSVIYLVKLFFCNGNIKNLYMTKISFI